MDARIVAPLGIVAAVAVAYAVVGGVEDPLADLPAEPAAPAEEVAAAPAEQVAAPAEDVPPSRVGPTPEQEAAMKAAAARPLSLEEALKPEAERKEPEAWRPAVVPVDTRERRNPPGTAPPPEAPLGPDVVGIEKLLVSKSAEVDRCMKWSAPTRAPGEESVVVQFTIVPDGPEKGRISKLDAIGDTSGRYANFLRCLSDVVAGASFAALRDPEEVVQWALRR